MLNIVILAKANISLAETVNPRILQLDLAPFSMGNPTISKKPLKIILPTNPFQESQNDFPIIIKQSFKAKHGDTLAAILKRTGVHKDDIYKSLLKLRELYNPRKFSLHQEISIFFKTSGEVEALKDADMGNFLGFDLHANLETLIRITKNTAGDFTARKVKRKLSSYLSRAEGVIHSNLYKAGIRAGLVDETLAELIRIFSWDIDFQRDIRKGDLFQVLFEKKIDEKGNVVRSNNIIFAAITLQDVPLMIYKFQNKNGTSGYYNKKGMSARKALMRTPIDGARLSSRYGSRRHPILNYTMIHRGIDFAAPKGTPIYAAGNGTIEEASWKGAYGRFILIRHNKRFSSAYAHLNNFASEIRKGKRVKQGQIIGFVGSSGRSTGPHLHYEIRRNGRQINPLKIRMPSGKKLAGKELSRFKKLAKIIDQKFANLKAQLPASASAN